MKKIILLNLIIFFCILEVVSYFYLKIDSRKVIEDFNREAIEKNQPILTQRYGRIKVADYHLRNFRDDNIGSKNKPSVIFFGCSYMYGYLLEVENTLPYLITKKTGRTTVNRGTPGGCILNMFRDLNTPDFYENLKKYPEPDYIIYLWIYDHLNRITNIYVDSLKTTNNTYYYINTKWIENDGKLEEIYPPKWQVPFCALYCVKAFHFIYTKYFSAKNSSKKMLMYFKMANKQLKEKFPNAKFVIIEYKDYTHKLLSEELRENLKKEDIIILNAEELAGHELDSEQWRASDKEHPNFDAFKDVSEGLIKALQL